MTTSHETRRLLVAWVVRAPIALTVAVAYSALISTSSSNVTGDRSPGPQGEPAEEPEDTAGTAKAGNDLDPVRLADALGDDADNASTNEPEEWRFGSAYTLR